MKALFWIFSVLVILGASGCVTAAKPRHVLISVVDETTKQPLAGIRVSTQDQEGRPFPDKSTFTDVITGPDGLAMLAVRDLAVSYYIHTKDDAGKYRWADSRISLKVGLI